MGNFQSHLFQASEAASVEQFRFKPTLKRFNLSVVVAVATPAHILLRLVVGKQVAETRDRVLAALVRVNEQSGYGLMHGQGLAQGFVDQVISGVLHKAQPTISDKQAAC